MHALNIAQGQLGQSEQPIGSNSGPMVDAYLAATGLRPGYAWCQSFVYWCYQQAAMQLHQTNPVRKTAGAMACWYKALPAMRITKPEALQHPLLIGPGTQFILDYGHGEGHTGIVERTEGLVIHTIEGNSNTDGSREGYEVVRHKRSIDDKLLIGFIKYS
ncbi:MAG: CHAP domain-containing protein [Taibaiella sp.]|nr:CHAP domain-containing protein [Taibaiella sp.]